MKTLNAPVHREPVANARTDDPHGVAVIVHHFWNRFVRSCLNFVHVFRRWETSKIRGVGFILVFVAVLTALIWKQRDYASDLWVQRAVLTMNYVERESKKEAGPYMKSLDAHKRLLEEALSNLELRRGKVPSKALKYQAQFEASFAKAKEALYAPVTNEKAADKSIKRSASALEVASKVLASAESSKPRFGGMLSADEAKPLIATFLADKDEFDKKATLLLSSSPQTFQQAEEACMASRFAAMSALLGWPELGRDEKASTELKALVAKLEFTQQATSKLSTLLNGDEQARLEKYASSEGRRLKLLRALRANNMEAAQESVAFANN